MNEKSKVIFRKPVEDTRVVNEISFGQEARLRHLRMKEEREAEKENRQYSYEFFNDDDDDREYERGF